MIGQSADEVNTLKIEVGVYNFKIKNLILGLSLILFVFFLFKDGDLNLNASPKALDKLLSHLLAFKVKIQPQYKNFAVLECFTNLTLIIDVLDMLPDAEVLFYGVVFLHYCYMYILFIC